MQRVQLSTIVWGNWRVDAFLSIGIQSLLAANNLPVFAAKHHVFYHIITSEDDAQRFSKSEVFSLLQSMMPVRLVTLAADAFQGTTLDDHVRNQHLRLREATEAAQAERAMPILIPPDVCWADGSFARVAELITTSDTVVYIKYVRVIDETVRSAITAKSTGETGRMICLTNREIAALAMEHLHPLYAMYLPESENWPEHLELSVWAARGEGFQLRVLVTNGFVLDAHAAPDHGARYYHC